MWRVTEWLRTKDPRRRSRGGMGTHKIPIGLSCQWRGDKDPSDTRVILFCPLVWNSPYTKSGSRDVVGSTAVSRGYPVLIFWPINLFWENVRIRPQRTTRCYSCKQNFWPSGLWSPTPPTLHWGRTWGKDLFYCREHRRKTPLMDT